MRAARAGEAGGKATSPATAPLRLMRKGYCDMANLDGQVALVTGAGTGVGRAAAVALAGAGASVVLCGRHEETLRETAKLAAQAGADSERIMVAPCDVAEADQVARMFE